MAIPFKTITETDAEIATARGLLGVALFVFDRADGEDWLRMKSDFGYLLNAIATDLSQADRSVARLYKEGRAANDGRRA